MRFALLSPIRWQKSSSAGTASRPRSDDDEFDDDDVDDDRRKTSRRCGERRPHFRHDLGRPSTSINSSTHVLARKQHYDLHKVLIPDVKAIDKWIAKVPAAQPAASRLLQHCLAELRAATAQPDRAAERLDARRRNSLQVRGLPDAEPIPAAIRRSKWDASRSARIAASISTSKSTSIAWISRTSPARDRRKRSSARRRKHRTSDA